MNYEVLIEKLMQHFTSAFFAEEVKMAKSEFIKWAGSFDEISSGLELKMAQFTDWYLFIRPFKSFGKPPIQLSSEESQFSFVPKDMYKRLAVSRHSLFEFLKLKRKDLYIRDIFSGYKFTIEDSPIVYGFNRGAIFEARLIPHGGGFVFSNSFCFHPVEATKYILKGVKKLEGIESKPLEMAREEIIRRLFKMRYRLEQYKHVPLEEIYTDKSKLA